MLMTLVMFTKEAEIKVQAQADLGSETKPPLSTSLHTARWTECAQKRSTRQGLGCRQMLRVEQ